MRRLLLLGLCFQFTVLPLYTQPMKWLRKSGQAALEQPTHKLPGKLGVSYQLDKRLRQSYQAAKQAMQQIPAGQKMPIGEIARRSFHYQDLDPAEIYPDIPFLTTPQQTANYLLARNNRLFLQELRRMKKIWAQLDTYLPTLAQEARQLEQPQDFTTWLADAIPAETKQLFIGEVHNYFEIQETVQRLLGLIRRKQPNREIILFTEFIPEELVYNGPDSALNISAHLHDYLPIWEEAVNNHITVIGLEQESIAQSPCTCSYISTTGGKKKEMSIWATLEGVRIRNEQWMRTLSKYRTQHPDALFIIYTGAAHAFYNRPFSLAANYPKENTFMAALYPNKRLTFTADWQRGRWHAPVVTEAPYSGPLESINEEADFPQPALKWSTSQLSQIAGFDVRIKVPIELERLDY